MKIYNNKRRLLLPPVYNVLTSPLSVQAVGSGVVSGTKVVGSGVVSVGTGDQPRGLAPAASLASIQTQTTKHIQHIKQ